MDTTEKFLTCFSYCLPLSFRAREALRQCLPDQLRDSTFAGCLQDDKSTKHWLTQLLKNLETGDPRGVTISPLGPQ